MICTAGVRWAGHVARMRQQPVSGLVGKTCKQETDWMEELY